MAQWRLGAKHSLRGCRGHQSAPSLYTKTMASLCAIASFVEQGEKAIAFTTYLRWAPTHEAACTAREAPEPRARGAHCHEGKYPASKASRPRKSSAPYCRSMEFMEEMLGGTVPE